jgi:hypothetical protein
MMARSFRAFGLLALCFFAQFALAAPAKKAPESARYGVYLAEARIGSLVLKSAATTFQNKPATQVDAEMSLQIVALGAPVDAHYTLSHTLDEAGKPLVTRLVIASLGRTTTVNARYEPQQVLCDLDASGQKSVKTVPIPKGVVLEADPDFGGFGTDKLKVGLKAVVYYFDPISLTIQKVSSEVVKAGARTVGGKEVPAFLLRTQSQGGLSDTWVDAKGQVLENSSASLGLRLVREDAGAERAATAYQPPKDFAIATSVKTAVRIPDPRKTGMLRLKVSGIPAPDLVLSDARQRVVSRDPEGGVTAAVYQIQSRELPRTALPATPGARDAGLEDAPYLGVDDPEIRKQAKELAGGETDRGVIARRVRAWVRARMQKPANVAAPRGAAEIMRSRDGVCRDYATLFAALARAAGVPTRICAGIVYFQGAFFYHAWNECRLTAGDDGWYAFDSTLDDDFVDATHVKFSQGGPTEIFAALQVVGQIKAEVLEYQAQ